MAVKLGQSQGCSRQPRVLNMESSCLRAMVKAEMEHSCCNYYR